MLGALLASCEESKFADVEVLRAQVPGGKMVHSIESVDRQVGLPVLPGWFFGGGHQVATGMNLPADPNDPTNNSVHRWGEYRDYHLDGPSAGGRETWGEFAQIGEYAAGVKKP